MPKQEPKQTTPHGADIPVPKRKEFYGNLGKMVKELPPAKRKGQPPA